MCVFPASQVGGSDFDVHPDVLRPGRSPKRRRGDGDRCMTTAAEMSRCKVFRSQAVRLNKLSQATVECIEAYQAYHQLPHRVPLESHQAPSSCEGPETWMTIGVIGV